jgi:hypothetical protein
VTGIPAILIGVLWYGLFYLRHSTAPTAPFAEFDMPRLIERIFRFDRGPVRAAAIAVQIWAAALAFGGALTLIEFIPPERAPSLQLAVTQYGIIAIGLLWLGIMQLSRWRG